MKVSSNILLIILGLICGNIYGETTENEFTWSVLVGAEYNSNLTVEELDVNSEVGGSLANLELYANYRIQLDDSSSLRLGYDFSQSLHKDFPEFNFQTNGLSAGYEKEVGDYTTSLDYSYYDAKLDNDSLLSLGIFSPAFSVMLKNNLLLRADYSFMDKQFDTLIFRDAASRKANLSSYYFFNGAKAYLRFSVSRTTEDAVSRQLDYRSVAGSVSVKTPVDWLTDGSIFKASYTYSDRDYDNLTLSIDAIRKEQKNQLSASFIIPLAAGVELIPAYEYNNRSSNFPAADYRENRMMLSVKFY